MSVNRNPLLSEPCFAAEGLSGTAAAASLRRLGSLMEEAPSGRLFAAISTLSEMSAKAAAALEHGSIALKKQDAEIAASQLSTALVQMDQLARESQTLPKTPRRRAAR